MKMRWFRSGVFWNGGSPKRHNVSVEGGTIYSTHQPCHVCAKMIINAGLTRVVYVGEYQDEIATQYLKLAGVKVDRFELGERALLPSAKPQED